MRSHTYQDPFNRHEKCCECGQSVSVCICTDLDEKAHWRLHSPLGLTIKTLSDQIVNRQQAGKSNHYLLIKLMKGVGSLADNMATLTEGGEVATPQIVFQEAITIAELAIRIAIEGDADFGYDPTAIFGE